MGGTNATNPNKSKDPVFNKKPKFKLVGFDPKQINQNGEQVTLPIIKPKLPYDLRTLKAYILELAQQDNFPYHDKELQALLSEDNDNKFAFDLQALIKQKIKHGKSKDVLGLNKISEKFQKQLKKQEVEVNTPKGLPSIGTNGIKLQNFKKKGLTLIASQQDIHDYLTGYIDKLVNDINDKGIDLSSLEKNGQSSQIRALRLLEKLAKVHSEMLSQQKIRLSSHDNLIESYSQSIKKIKKAFERPITLKVTVFKVASDDLYEIKNKPLIEIESLKTEDYTSAYTHKKGRHTYNFKKDSKTKHDIPEKVLGKSLMPDFDILTSAVGGDHTAIHFEGNTVTYGALDFPWNKSAIYIKFFFNEDDGTISYIEGSPSTVNCFREDQKEVVKSAQDAAYTSMSKKATDSNYYKLLKKALKNNKDKDNLITYINAKNAQDAEKTKDTKGAKKAEVITSITDSQIHERLRTHQSEAATLYSLLLGRAANKEEYNTITKALRHFDSPKSLWKAIKEGESHLTEWSARKDFKKAKKYFAGNYVKFVDSLEAVNTHHLALKHIKTLTQKKDVASAEVLRIFRRNSVVLREVIDKRTDDIYASFNFNNVVDNKSSKSIHEFKNKHILKIQEFLDVHKFSVTLGPISNPKDQKKNLIESTSSIAEEIKGAAKDLAKLLSPNLEADRRIYSNFLKQVSQRTGIKLNIQTKEGLISMSQIDKAVSDRLNDIKEYNLKYFPKFENNQFSSISEFRGSYDKKPLPQEIINAQPKPLNIAGEDLYFLSANHFDLGLRTYITDLDKDLAEHFDKTNTTCNDDQVAISSDSFNLTMYYLDEDYTNAALVEKLSLENGLLVKRIGKTIVNDYDETLETVAEAWGSMLQATDDKVSFNQYDNAQVLAQLMEHDASKPIQKHYAEIAEEKAKQHITLLDPKSEDYTKVKKVYSDASQNLHDYIKKLETQRAKENIDSKQSHLNLVTNHNCAQIVDFKSKIDIHKNSSTRNFQEIEDLVLPALENAANSLDLENSAEKKSFEQIIQKYSSALEEDLTIDLEAKNINQEIRTAVQKLLNTQRADFAKKFNETKKLKDASKKANAQTKNLSEQSDMTLPAITKTPNDARVKTPNTTNQKIKNPPPQAQEKHHSIPKRSKTKKARLQTAETLEAVEAKEIPAISKTQVRNVERLMEAVTGRLFEEENQLVFSNTDAMSARMRLRDINNALINQLNKEEKAKFIEFAFSDDDEASKEVLKIAQATLSSESRAREYLKSIKLYYQTVQKELAPQRTGNYSSSDNDDLELDEVSRKSKDLDTLDLDEELDINRSARRNDLAKYQRNFKVIRTINKKLSEYSFNNITDINSKRSTTYTTLELINEEIESYLRKHPNSISLFFEFIYDLNGLYDSIPEELDSLERNINAIILNRPGTARGSAYAYVKRLKKDYLKHKAS